MAHQGAIFEKSPGVNCLAVTVQDITQRVQNEELIRYKTFYDSITELPNKIYFKEHLPSTIRESQSDETLLAILFVGLDRFKKINDSFDHLAGDQVLRMVAERIGKMECSRCFVCRYEGDVFALQLSDMQTVHEVEAFARKILKSIAEPLVINDTEIFLTASIGISIYPMAGDNVEELIRSADAARREASKNGGNQYMLHQDGDEKAAYKHIVMERDIRHAISAQEFEVHYQPQVDAKTKKVVGAEALIRWIHPENGFISPDEFIPLAEEVGLINQIGMFVIESVCEKLGEWKDKGLGDLRVGINLSAPQFKQKDLVSFVRAMITVMELSPSQLELEITERIAVSDFEQSVEMLTQLKKIGVKTSMDDFGTGYSSLSYIQDLPIDTLKIDRAFVKDINDAGEHGEIARAVINMANSLGMHTIAEGIETDAQYQFFKFNGADEIQGWYFSKALPANEFEAYVIKQNGLELTPNSQQNDVMAAIPQGVQTAQHH
ncbi:MAG: bifunctional diguanylate cyclase/phosphodiesterase [Gammaproteobacteria bacterium]|nr:bifunctional diguanylate cyclase/phosphodiesterase [Gammaproteobacteria bacterium]